MLLLLEDCGLRGLHYVAEELDGLLADYRLVFDEKLAHCINHVLGGQSRELLGAVPRKLLHIVQ